MTNLANSSKLPAKSSACYLVTGAAGFIASKVCELLLADGHTVVGIDNLNDYYDVRLKDYRLRQLLGRGYELGGDAKTSAFTHNKEPLTHNRFEFRVLDIENIQELDELFATRKFEAVFNLAARAGVRASLENPAVYRSTNIVGEENVLTCQVKHGVKKHVLASSSSVYAGCPMPFSEDSVLGTMQSPYAETKRRAEEIAREYHEKHGLDVTVLRYFTVFGPAGRPDMAPYRFVHWVATGQPIKLYGDGNQSRDFTYVDDIARGTVLAARLLGGPSTVDGGRSAVDSSSGFSAGFEIINLGGGNRPMTINTMIQLIEAELNQQHGAMNSELGEASTAGSPSTVYRARIDRHPVNAADMADTQADITKAGQLLGWKPQVSPEEGFRKTVEWYLANAGWLEGVRV